MDYHLKDNLALGGRFGYSIASDSALAENLAAKRPNRVKAGGFSDLQLNASVELTYTPIFGKMAFLGRTVLDYDLHVLVGVGIASERERLTLWGITGWRRWHWRTYLHESVVRGGFTSSGPDVLGCPKRCRPR